MIAMKSFTYFAVPIEGGPIKIGRSKNPNVRMKQIRPTVSLFAVVPESDLSEKAAHELFSDHRVKGEWFDITEGVILDTLSKCGISPEFSTPSHPRSGMKVLIEIDDDLGDTLDAMAKEQDRSRSAQARHMLQRAIRESVESVETPENEPQEITA